MNSITVQRSQFPIVVLNWRIDTLRLENKKDLRNCIGDYGFQYVVFRKKNTTFMNLIKVNALNLKFDRIKSEK